MRSMPCEFRSCNIRVFVLTGLMIVALTLITVNHLQYTIPAVNTPLLYHDVDLSNKSQTSLLYEQTLLGIQFNPQKYNWIQTSRSYLTIHPLDGSAGRLGNFLFRYAAALEIAQRHNMTLVLPDTQLVTKMRTFFYITMPTESELGIKPTYMKIYEKSWGKFDSNLFSLPGSNNVCLQMSYTQSFKYFEKTSKRVRHEFQIKPPYASTSSSLIKSLKETHNATAVIGLHVRRGDFLNPNLDKYGYTVAPKEFFTKAINYFREKYGNKIVFLIATDDQKWCHLYLEFQNIKHFYGVAQSPIEDFSMLVRCDHHIVSVGSFGWWAAWLGSGEVVYYKNWPRPGSPHSKNHNPADYYPPHWIGMA